VDFGVCGGRKKLSRICRLMDNRMYPNKLDHQMLIEAYEL
jgi:hypothetical protein